jgi:uncharacterized membrane-anchored protein
MIRMLAALGAPILALLLCFPVLAQDAPPAEATPEDQAAQIRAFVDSLKLESGTVALPEAKATLKLQSDMRFLRGPDAERVLTELWGNPPGSNPVGMLLPSAGALTDEKGYAVVLTYNDDGYVSDEEAAGIDYDKMLKDLQEDARSENAAREKAGYGSVELVGWAEAPRYDSTSNKLYWAKRLKFDRAAEDTVNYDVRVLGRAGYLSLNAVARIDQLETIRAEMPRVIELAEFDPGARYADYQEGSDKVAAYGIAALVAGGVAAKAGLFGKLFAALIAAKKLLIPLVLGLFALVAKLVGRFGRKEGKTAA